MPISSHLVVDFLRAEELLLPALENSFGPCEAFGDDNDCLIFQATPPDTVDGWCFPKAELIATLRQSAGRWCVVTHIEWQERDWADFWNGNGEGSPLVAYAPTAKGVVWLAAEQLHQWAAAA
jgi:hypothetical protein